MGLLREWREGWAELGHDTRIDHRGLRGQGIELEPQHEIGPSAARRGDRGEDAERAAEHRAVARRNGDALSAGPSVALDALTQQQSTFTWQITEPWRIAMEARLETDSVKALLACNCRRLHRLQGP